MLPKKTQYGKVYEFITDITLGLSRAKMESLSNALITHKHQLIAILSATADPNPNSNSLKFETQSAAADPAKPEPATTEPATAEPRPRPIQELLSKSKPQNQSKPLKISVDLSNLSKGQRNYVSKKMGAANLEVINGLQFVEWINEYNKMTAPTAFCNYCNENYSVIEVIISKLESFNDFVTQFHCKKCYSELVTLNGKYKLERIIDDKQNT